MRWPASRVPAGASARRTCARTRPASRAKTRSTGPWTQGTPGLLGQVVRREGDHEDDGDDDRDEDPDLADQDQRRARRLALVGLVLEFLRLFGDLVQGIRHAWTVPDRGLV